MILVLALSGGCSGGNDREEKSGIDKATEKVATDIVDTIQKPIDKAEAVKALEEQRAEQYKKQAE
jgi:hypothetical protein